MIRSLSSALLASAIAVSVASAETSDKTTAPSKVSYGSPINLTQKTTLSEAAKMAASNGAEVLVEAEIRQVCQAKGCWMEISDGDTRMRVSFKGYSFFVPKDAGGKRARVQGQVVEKKESVAEQRHYLKDAGAGKKEMDAVKEPKTVRSFVASGVEISS